MQNLVVLIEKSKFADETPLKSANMILNRFCVDEDAVCELSGVNNLITPRGADCRGMVHKKSQTKEEKAEGKEHKGRELICFSKLSLFLS